jgi:hypothetical protein
MRMNELQYNLIFLFTMCEEDVGKNWIQMFFISMSISPVPTVSQNAMRAHKPSHKLDDYSESTEGYSGTID